MNSNYKLVHVRSRGEPRALPRAHIQPRGERLGPFLFPTFAIIKSLPDFHDVGPPRRFPLSLDTSQQQGSSNCEGNYAAIISPHFKYSPIPVGSVMNSGRYFDMPIPIIKTSNLNDYRKIPTFKSCRSEKSAPAITALQNTYTPRDP